MAGSPCLKTIGTKPLLQWGRSVEQQYAEAGPCHSGLMYSLPAVLCYGMK